MPIPNARRRYVAGHRVRCSFACFPATIRDRPLQALCIEQKKKIAYMYLMHGQAGPREFRVSRRYTAIHVGSTGYYM